MPVRTCVGCRKRAEKNELIRIVMTPEGASADLQGTKPGRGVYVCPGGTCLEAALKKGGLARSLKRRDITAVSGFTEPKDSREGSK